MRFAPDMGLIHRHAAEWLRAGSFARVWRFILLSLAGKRNKPCVTLATRITSGPLGRRTVTFMLKPELKVANGRTYF